MKPGSRPEGTGTSRCMPDTLSPLPTATAPPKLPSRLELVALIASLMALNALAIDIMLPGLAQMSADLGLLQGEAGNENKQQLIIFAFVLGFGAPQLVWGPITDRFGRRGPLFVAIAGYFVTSLGCILMQDFNALLVMRFIQGVFASGARICATSLVRDLFAGRAMASFMSLTMTIFMIIPIVAPIIGQGILRFAPWEGIFIVLAVFSTSVGAFAFFRLPETLPPENRRPLNWASISQAYGLVVRTPVTFGYMAASGIIFGALFSFIASSEQIVRVVFDEADHFALFFGIVAGMLAVTNFTNSKVVERFGMRRISHAALLAFIALASVNALLTYFYGENIYRFMVLFALNFGCFGLMGSNFSALALEPLGRVAGTAAAAYGFSTTVVSSLIGYYAGQQFNGTTLPLLISYVLIGVAALVAVLVTEKGVLFKSR